MKFELWITIFFGTILIIYFATNRNKVNIIKSQNNNTNYVVRNLPDKQEAANLLGKLEKNIFELINYLEQNKNNNPKHKIYVELLTSRCSNLKLSEGDDDNRYTTYTLNKGEEIVFCLRSKKTHNLHDVNLLMFVTIHELSHIACPERDHTALFLDIFKFMLQQAISANLYKYQNYAKDEIEYCGMILNETPI
jgi:hypothetical protein